MGSHPVAQPKVVRFGLYELDLDARELRKSGVRIKLQDQPFQILSMLLERPGSVVTREELQRKLWPEDVFVDFDLSLNSAVKKLRQALNDDSENPRFIETLYRRGYRFIGPVNGPAADSPDQLDAPSAPPSAAPPRPARAETSVPDIHSKQRQFVYVVAAFLCFIALIALVTYRLVPPGPPRVLGFTQITHDGLFKGAMVSDGERLYLVEMTADHFAIAQVSVEGGETSALPTNFANVVINGITPNHSALVVNSFEGTGKKLQPWLLSLPSGTIRRVSQPRIDSLAGAPDGKHVVFSEGSDLYSANDDLSGAQKLATIPNPVVGIQFSPDGTRLRFDIYDQRKGSSIIGETDRYGHGFHQFLPDWGRDSRQCCGAWTPDGKYFVFQSFHDGRNNLWALPERTTWLGAKPTPIQLTNGPLDFTDPLPSSDGKRIFAIGSQPRCEIIRYDGRSDFAPYFDGRSVKDLAFSPDGKWVAYVTVPEGQLWRSRVDGSERLQLIPDRILAGLPRWSPDGKQIVFMATDLKTDWLAYLVSPDGSGLRRLIPGAQSGYDPGFSPDGKSIVLALDAGGPGQHDPDGPSSVIKDRIAIYDLQTKKVSPLPGTNQFFSPRWSPDGRYIAAITDDSSKMMLFDWTTKQWQELVNLYIGYPTWSHDSRYIYFDTDLSDDSAFYRVRISDHKLERLFSLKGTRRFWGAFGPWTGLTPDDTPLLVRDTSSQEIYAIDWDAP